MNTMPKMLRSSLAVLLAFCLLISMSVTALATGESNAAEEAVAAAEKYGPLADQVVDLMINNFFANSEYNGYFVKSLTKDSWKTIIIDVIVSELDEREDMLTEYGIEPTAENKELLANTIYDIAVAYHGVTNNHTENLEEGKYQACIDAMEFALTEVEGLQNADAEVYYDLYVTSKNEGHDAAVEKAEEIFHEHSYTAVVTAPTCTKAGYTTYTCTCGDSYTADETSATGHKWSDWTQTEAPTCTEIGTETRTCSECNESETRKVEAVGHDYQAVVTQPTCTAKGYTTYTCTVCGDSYIADYVDATDHSWSDWTQTEAPTCTETGTETRTCSECDASETRDVEATGHDYQATVTQPNCTEDGYTTYTCSVCGDSYEADKTEAKGHSYEAVVTAPTCTEGGYTTYVCVCGDSYVADEVAATGHATGEAVVENEAAATCTEDGSYDTVVYCAKCDAELSRETTVVEATGHTAGEAVVENEVAATCTEDGSYDIVVYCAECDAQLSRETIIVEANGGHNYTAETVDPTCVDQGYTTYTCEACGDSYVDDYVAATGHNYVLVESEEATCEEDGYECYRCDGCGDEYQTVLEATGHNYEDGVCTNCGDEEAETDNGWYGNWLGKWFNKWFGSNEDKEECEHSYTSVVTDPTCTERGYTTHTCDKCGDTYKDSYVDATGHNYVDGVCEYCGAKGTTSSGSWSDWIKKLFGSWRS